MPPRPSTKKPNSNPFKKRAPENKPQRQQLQQKEEQQTPLDNPASTIPLTLQQLLLNVFQSALVPNTPASQHDQQNQSDANDNEGELDLKPLIQTIKSHLYNRDFDSAFTDANEELLRAYALRWSASRTLGYAGIFKAVLGLLSEDKEGRGAGGQIVCIGGGAGAEIVALAGVRRDIVAAATDTDTDGEEGEVGMELKVTTVDIADWSGVVGRLDVAIRSSKVSGSKRHPAPLLPDGNGDKFGVAFQKADVLSLPEGELKSLYGQGTVMVTLMFTLNELFSTSMAKATAFLLRTTDVVDPGTLFLVVDSPGSYSSLSLGKSEEKVERKYPMKFLLDHTLLSVAEGKWEKVLSQDSRWWRRDAARLQYDVGEGAGLEDMRFQVHLYRRL